MILNKYSVIFWDFDGVIKDSLQIKTTAFYNLFLEFGLTLAKKVKNHHIQNSGISRYVKIPIYLRWAKQDTSNTNINYYCDKFSSIVCKGVINSDWVDGVEKLIRNKPKKQKYILVSATPQNEIEIILNKIKISKFFEKIYGSPNDKSDVIKKEIKDYKLATSNFLMIGDAKSDYDAAVQNNISFILRKHDYNSDLTRFLNIKIVDNFNSFCYE